MIPRLISTFPSIFFLLPSPAAQHTAGFFPSSLLQVNNGERNTASQSHPSTRPFALHSITPPQREQFWLIYIDCWGPFPIRCSPDEKRREERGRGPRREVSGKENPNPTHSSKQHLPRLEPGKAAISFPSYFFPVAHLDKYLSVSVHFFR